MLEFRKEGIYCPQGRFYIDPWLPVDYAIITHAHSDHARIGMKKYLCHKLTAPILKLRLGKDIKVQTLEYAETIIINSVKVSLFPAGHLIGSAQVRLEYQGKVTVVSGDYKIQDDGLSTPFEPVICHEFISESTFGLPIYNWLPVSQINQNLRDWVAHNKRNGINSVIIGYALGKAQRIMKALEGYQDLYVHYAISKINTAFINSGIKLPAYKDIDFNDRPKDLKGEIIIVPPSLFGSNMLKNIPNAQIAICSGWMQVRGARRWRSADAGFAISDHADWSGLLTAVKESRAEKVYVTHGFKSVFARYLNEIGTEAEEITTAFGVEEETDENLIKEQQ
ncbi:ligase-associated DNA damage response exonuclease [Sphingobacterium sp. WM]|uniref:ligase-associated DNA damage response exonuclease n=1 Tax=Sphingobacterium sp. WM TaxID=3031802 RepID=UPI00240D9765|nr:ligase-associated DNA damage response exonuclease [Sphingobacterium sp. WM]WFB62138.1 ligase-associated DNA damage response exonuclease [Sphingobacterium sp. WM]